MELDRAAVEQAENRAVLLALLARGADPQRLFPELFGAPEAEESADVIEEYDQVDWQVPSSMDEWVRTAAALADTRVDVKAPAEGWSV